MLDDRVVEQVAGDLGLAPVCLRIATDGLARHRLRLAVHCELVVAVLAPVDPERVAVEGPVGVRREVIALEVVVAVGLEPDGKAAAGPLELPLGAGPVTDEGELWDAQWPEELGLAPILLVGLVLRDRVAFHGLGLRVKLKLVPPELSPVNVHDAIGQLPPAGCLESCAEEVASWPEAYLKRSAAPGEVVPADDVRVRGHRPGTESPRTLQRGPWQAQAARL
mmetsp:Transcript_28308/g.76677  ORF Transcript_28308/g.76677 Transcript_28308/m.76677 type:complete len:222 (-) Transcript_28308:29-694(-)